MTNPWNDLRAEFESFSDFLDFVDADQDGMLEKPRQVSRHSKNSGGMGPSWYGSKSWEEAIDLARRGWSEGTEKLEKLRAPMVDKLMPVILRPEISYDVVGTGGLDMGRVMAGMPDPFMEWIESETPVFGSGRQLVRIVLNMAVSCGVDAKNIVTRGAAVAALVDALEAAGRRVSVVVVESVTGYSTSSPLVAAILVKRPDATLNIDTLTFALAHPSMLRRLIFSLQERHPNADIRNRYGIPGSYGLPTDVNPEQRGDIYLGAMRYDDPNFVSEASTRKWVIAQLVAQGVQLDQDLLKKEGLL